VYKRPKLPDLVVVLAVEDPQDSQEQVQDVQVEADRSGDLFLDVVVANHKLSVDENVSREYQSSHDTVSKLHAARLREESSHESEEDQHPESTEQVRHPAGEVVLGLAGEECKSDEDAECEDECLQDDSRLVHAGDHRDTVGFKCGERCEEGEVHGLYMLLVSRQASE
jgi:hypothetical protein